MSAIDRIGELLGLRSRRGGSALVQLINPESGIISAIDEFAIAPYVGGNEAMVLLQKMMDTDTHLEGLYRRISIAILSSQVAISCEDDDVEKFVNEAMGIVDGRPPMRFLRFLNELVSSLHYGFSLHRWEMVNDDMGSMIKLRRIEPVDVHEFVVNGDDLVSVAESYQDSIHGVNADTRKFTTKDSRGVSKEIDVVDIPADELLHVAPLQLGRNYWGRSIFRSAIGTWANKIIYLFCDAIRQSRFSVPLLVGMLEDLDKRIPEDASSVAKVLNLPATAINRMLIMRANDKIESISPSGNTELLESIRYIDFSHSKLVLEQFVDVGDKAWGSRSTYSAGSDDFYDSLNFYEMAVLAGVYEYATMIADANFPEHPPMHTHFKELGVGRQRMIELWEKMVTSRVVRRGKQDEPFFRNNLGMPEYEEPEDGDLAPGEPGQTTTVVEEGDGDDVGAVSPNGAPTIAE